MAGERSIDERARKWRKIRHNLVVGGAVPMALVVTATVAVFADSGTSNNPATNPSVSTQWCGNDTLGYVDTINKVKATSFEEVAQNQDQYFEDEVTINRPSENLIFKGAPKRVDVVTDGRHGTVRSICGYEQRIESHGKTITILMPLRYIKNWNLHSAENNIRSVSGAVLPLVPAGNVFVVDRTKTAA
jgi:hypothetical protein